jgi:aspartyl-tRNA(Asn)/glutamyl-tRNA(Gln) amidotransferase subunit A
MALDLTALTIDSISRDLASGALTAEQLTRACLDRIAALNPAINAIIFLNDFAIDEARAIDRRRAAGEALGPLAGVPFVAKDTMNVAGIPTTGGWRLLSSRTGGIDLIPDRDSAVVARMRAAGAVLLGKTNVPVLSATGTHADDSWAGPTLNAVAEGLVPGGSSAGTAAAVASGMAVIGLAEETGGSIQNPAAAHGLVGIKPTFGLVANSGVMPLGGSSLDVVGPIARTVRDAAMMLDVLAGEDADDPKTAASAGRLPPNGYAESLTAHHLAGRRLGLYGPGWRMPNGRWRNGQLAAAVVAAYETVQRRLRDLGATLVEDPFAGSGFTDLADLPEGGDEYDVRGIEGLPHDLENWLKGLGPDAALSTFAAFAEATRAEDPFSAGGVLASLSGVAEFEASRTDPAAVPPLKRFHAARTAYLAIFDAVMDRLSLDALVFPQAADPLPRRGAGVAIRETTVSEINIAGLPAVTLPAGRLATGEPFNIIFVGRLWSEPLLLGMADDFERAAQTIGI